MPGVISEVFFVKIQNSSFPNENVGRIPCEICQRIAQCTPQEISELLTEGNFKQTPECHSHEIIEYM